MNAYWIVLPFLAGSLGYCLSTKAWGLALVMGFIVAFDVFAGTIVTLGDHGYFPLG